MFTYHLKKYAKVIPFLAITTIWNITSYGRVLDLDVNNTQGQTLVGSFTACLDAANCHVINPFSGPHSYGAFGSIDTGGHFNSEAIMRFQISQTNDAGCSFSVANADGLLDLQAYPNIQNNEGISCAVNNVGRIINLDIGLPTKN